MEEIAGTKLKEGIVKPLEVIKKRKLPTFALPLAVILIIIAAGAITGYFLSSRGRPLSPSQIVPGASLKGKEFGSADTSAFPDEAEGVVEKGGIDGEGTHKLIREGGESQTAYLTSSIIDLDPLVGKKVKVWGETFKGQKASWLMDVGRVKVLD